MEYRGSVLSEVALGVALTTYVITEISFFGTIRLDFPDNAHTNYMNTSSYDMPSAMTVLSRLAWLGYGSAPTSSSKRGELSQAKP
jgi:hypothetical protein